MEKRTRVRYDRWRQRERLDNENPEEGKTCRMRMVTKKEGIHELREATTL